MVIFFYKIVISSKCSGRQKLGTDSVRLPEYVYKTRSHLVIIFFQIFNMAYSAIESKLLKTISRLSDSFVD